MSHRKESPELGLPAVSAGGADPTPLQIYDAAHERFQNEHIRELIQTIAALVCQMMEASLVPRVSPLDLAADPPEIKSRLDPATGDQILWVVGLSRPASHAGAADPVVSPLVQSAAEIELAEMPSLNGI